MAWWKRGTIYQIYPRSFLDTSGNGIGDLGGVIEKLDYLQYLGIDAIWLSPVFPSPQYDFGYDVSDYYSINPLFGSEEDFDFLLKEAHRRNIRIILDLVLNHTSHQHPWFLESFSNRNNPKADWYIWADPKGKRPPNNWKSVFGGSAWKWNDKRRQFYLHSFTPQQPDLNWRNPEVKKELLSIFEYWLEKGVDGFRLDVVDFFLKDEFLRSNPYCIGRRPYEMQKHIYDKNRPENIQLMQEIRKTIDRFPQRMAVGEVAERNVEIAAAYYGPNNDGLHLNFNFEFLEQPWKPQKFCRAIEKWENLLEDDNWPAYTLSNHDVPRYISRYGNSIPRAKVAAAMLFSLRGTPFIYYGEEIGMTQTRIPKREIKDPVGKRYWPIHPGRDGCRTPMQWNSDLNAGFTSSTPWLKVNPNYKKVNVEKQVQKDHSLFHFYRKLIQCRKKHPPLQNGKLQISSLTNQNILAYWRKTSDESILVLLNFSSQKQTVTLSPSEGELIFTCPKAPAEFKRKKIHLPPEGMAFLLYQN